MTRILAAVAFLVVCAAGAVSTLRIHVSNDVAAFLPDGEDNERAQILKALLASEGTRASIYVIEAPTADTALAASRDFRSRLENDPGIERIENGVSDDATGAVFELYRDRALYFASPDARHPSAWTDHDIAQTLNGLRDELALPTGGLASSTAASDPLRTFAGHLEALESLRPVRLHVLDGLFVSEDERHAVVFVTSRASPFDARSQGPLLARIQRAFADTNQAHQNELVLEQSGFARFAVASERAVRDDVSRISIVSSLGVILFTLLLFRSLRFLLLTAVPVVVGLAAAVTVSYLVFGSVHGITLAFGCSLIGVTEDYPVHLLNHHMFASAGTTPRESLKRVWIGLLLGAGTTAVGLLGLASTTFLAMREIAVFASVGVVAALLATRYLVPPFVRTAGGAPPQARVAILLERALSAVRTRRAAVAAIWVVTFAIVAVGVPRIRWNDDLSSLNEDHSQWRAEDARVRALIGASESTRLAVARGNDDEAALEANDALQLALEAAVDAHELDGYQNIHAVLWSQASQRASAQTFDAAPNCAPRFREQARVAGFRDGAFDPFLNAASVRPRTPLTPDELRASPLGELVARFRLTLPGGVAYVSTLRGVRDEAALSQRIGGVAGATYFDQKRFLRDAYGEFRSRTLQLLGIGLLGVLLLAAIRYRRVRAVSAVCLPAWTAAAATLGVLGIFGIEGNLMHLLALVLVLSMGVDYGIFMAEHHHAKELPSTLLSVVTASVTTILSFGLLAISSNPALRSLGMATGIGLFLSMILAPLALLSLRAESESAR